MNFLPTLQKALAEGKITEAVYQNFVQLFSSYAHSLAASGLSPDIAEPIFQTYLAKVIEHTVHPYRFLPFHQKISSPFDYYSFGLEFMKPLVISEKSKIERLENADIMEKQLKEGENVILYANHQTEVDPQLLSIALEKTHPLIASEIIFVAGDRVTTDPMAIPFSMGRNLLCIFSKRHIDNPPEKKLEKQHHNQRTMRLMRDLFSEGGKCIYVAPSGGRDRPNAQGEVDVAPFDAQSIEMFRLMAEQAKRPSHFYPLALATFDLLPPPQTIEHGLGEVREAKREGIFFSFGNEIDMKHYPGSDNPDRHERRAALALHIWNLVQADYQLLKKYL